MACLQPAALLPASLSATSVARAEVFDFESAPLDSLPQGWSVTMTHEGGQPRWAIVRAGEGGQALAQLSSDRAKLDGTLGFGVETLALLPFYRIKAAPASSRNS